MQNKIIDDFVAKDTRVEDLVERIRFIVMHHQEIGKAQSNVEEQRIRIVDTQMILRRILEVSFSLLLLTFLSPLLIIIAALIKLESKNMVKSFKGG